MCSIVMVFTTLCGRWMIPVRPNYHVAYGTSKSPLGPIKVAKKPVVLIQDPAKEIYGPAHNAVLQIPGTDEWYIVYHRINKNFIDREKGPGVHREVCIDRMELIRTEPSGRLFPRYKRNMTIKHIP